MRDNSIWSTEMKDIVSIDITGERHKVNVPVKIHKPTGRRMVFVDDLMKAEQKKIAEDLGIKLIDIQELLLIYTDSRYFEGRRKIEKTFRFNKMLFYFWKELNKTLYGNSYVHDEFGAARAGPVPKTLKPSLRELESKGLVKVKWSHKPGISSVFTLTEKGEEVASKLWRKTPNEVKMVYKEIKTILSLISPEELKHKVHKDYPEYRKFYTEVDKED